MLRNGTLFANERRDPAVPMRVRCEDKPPQFGVPVFLRTSQCGRFFSMFAKLVSSFSSALFTKTFMALSAAKKIAYLAVFAAIAVAVNAISIDVTPSFKLSLTATVGFLAGSLFGPVGGFSVMFIGDIIGGFLAGYVPNPVITIGTSFLGLIPGIIVPYCKWNIGIKIILCFVLCGLISTMGINAYGTYLFVASKYTSYWAYLVIARVPQLAVTLANAVFSYIAVKLLNRSGTRFTIE